MSLSNPRRRSAAAPTESGTDMSLKTSMTLRKGATFHSPTFPTPAEEQTFLPPRLPRSHSHMADVVDANRRRIALTLTEIDEALSLEKLSLSAEDEQKGPLRDTSLPVPRGFLPLNPVMDKDSQRRVLRPRSVRRANNHPSDSGIGSSLCSTSTNDKGDTVEGSKKKTKKQGSAAAITRSPASANVGGLPSLGPKAVNRIHEHTLGPLLERTQLKDFEPIVLDIPRRIRSKEIICLRDLEKTLLFMAPVSQLSTDPGVWGDTYRTLLVKEKSKTGILYLDFCLTSIRCIQATVEYLTDREQVRPGDRPYTNGYFIDLKDQLLQYGRDLAASKGDDSMDIDQYVPRFVPLQTRANPTPRADEIQLYGGMSENGRPAELVRIKKDGTVISMATGKPIDIATTDGPIQFKRSLSEQREDEEEIMRSMARRKKNATAEELAPKKCREPGCFKEFKRPCDLTKHEKTHSRPWKCPIPTCKYHEFGWPTEKEMDRHVNDKHSDRPAMFECQFKPCPYKSKRESNCKQHMEKAHGWNYVRTKTNGGKKLPANSPSSVHQTPPLGHVSTPSDAYSVPTPPQDNHPVQAMPNDFPLYQTEADWLDSYGRSQDNVEGMDLTLEHLSPSSAVSYDQYPPYQNGSQFIITDEDIYAATARIPNQQLPTPDGSTLYNKMMPRQHLPLHQPQSFDAAQHFHTPQVPAPHFSPNAQHNAMLYTPPEQIEDGYDDTFSGVDGADFQLFPANMGKGNSMQPLFGEVPSADMGFSQTSQPEIFQQIDLSQLDYQNFHE
ncbi:copper-binding transcription factor [Amphichorda felina]